METATVIFGSLIFFLSLIQPPIMDTSRPLTRSCTQNPSGNTTNDEMADTHERSDGLTDDQLSVTSHRSHHSRTIKDLPESCQRSEDHSRVTDDKRSVSASHRSSHNSRVSSVSRASSMSARRDALVEAAATNAALEYEKILADKKRQLDEESEKQQQKLEQQELQRREAESRRADEERDLAQRRADEERELARRREEEERELAQRRTEEEREMTRRKSQAEREMALRKAESEREMAVLSASKEAAIAKAKLLAIEQAIREEDERSSRADSDSQVSRRRTEDWIQSQTLCGIPDTDTPANGINAPIKNTTRVSDEVSNRYHQQVSTDLSKRRCDSLSNHENGKPQGVIAAVGTSVPTEQISGSTTATTLVPVCNPNTESKSGFAGNAPVFVPRDALHGHVNATPESVSLATVSSQLAASLARQNLPKYEPDVFDGDVTLFYPWKASFQSMLQDADVSAAHELTLLRKFTKGEPQKMVDCFRKRLYQNPADAVRDVWASLDAKFGNTAAVANTYLDMLFKGAKFGQTDLSRLQDFANICSDVKCQTQYLPGLGCLDYGNVLQPTIDRLPPYLRAKWEKIVVDYAKSHANAYPPFDMFAELMQDQSDLKNHPNIHLGGSNKGTKDNAVSPSDIGHQQRHDNDYRILKSDTHQSTPYSSANFCPIHEIPGHNLTNCNIFPRKSWSDKSDILKKAGLCSRCLTAKHAIQDCKVKDIECKTCGSNRHRTLFHTESTPMHTSKDNKNTSKDNNVQSMCTTVCGGHTGGFSCCKMLLVDVYPTHHPERVQRVYAIMDEQSNACMITPELIDTLGVDGSYESYHLSTCSGEKEMKYGRQIPGLVVRSISGVKADLPICIECENIPSDKREIANPTVAIQFTHLRKIADKIPDVDDAAKVCLLIGRNAPELLKVRSFINGPSGAPWAQELTLGWTISGQACLDKASGAVHVIVHKASARLNRPTEESDDIKFDTIPCPNSIDVRMCDVFHERCDDNEVGMSQEDIQFMKVMDESYHKNGLNNCEMPLPLRDRNVSMPQNRIQALKRLNSLQRTFARKPEMKDDYMAFMKNIFDRKHASVISENDIKLTQDSERVWYLPHFGVYHPKKPNKIRVVFDSAAEYKGVSLNKVLLSGPDQMNCLLGVLIRFRLEKIAIICDIEQMFQGFHVNQDDRDLIRFLWFKDHDTDGEIIDCRMNVHLFGNVSSPAVATYGLRRTANEGRQKYGNDACEFVNKNFYVDDGLTSCSSERDAISLIQNTQKMLFESNLRLHKIASNSTVVMSTLPEDDRAKGLQELDLHNDVLPSIRSLGVMWNMDTDSFSFKVNLEEKPFSRRGLLSVINSVYDPIGIAAPVIISGKLILQQANVLCKENPDRKVGWDDPLPIDMLNRWQTWKNDLVLLGTVSVPRCYHNAEFGSIATTEIHAFSDASKDAIGVAIYLRQLNDKGDVSVSLMYGQAKVAPIRLTTIPRLELCAAVLASEATQKISKELHTSIDSTHYYTDSKIVLGYIQNNSRRFHVYVANRVQRIRNVSTPTQWHYVDTTENPADIATRGVRATKLSDSIWINGPQFLKEIHFLPSIPEEIPLDQEDPDVRTVVEIRCTTVDTSTMYLDTKRFERFSTWSSARRAIGILINVAKKFAKTADDIDIFRPSDQVLRQAEYIIISNVQRDAFERELNTLRKTDSHKDQKPNAKNDLKSSSLYKLDPFVDTDGLVRVGGRLRRSELPSEEKHPIILPRNHHISKLMIEHHHLRVHHQGRLITHGAVRSAGYWIIGGQSKVSNTISGCVTCRRLRGQRATQKMADLPADRLECVAPFTNVGFDVFGPWLVTTRKLRGGCAENKRWALILTCLVSRAIHIEVLESMDSSSFISALRRFFALRGPAALLRCDCGTNFVGGKKELEEALRQMNVRSVEKFVTEYGCKWQFNPPHSSHHVVFGNAKSEPYGEYWMRCSWNLDKVN